MVKRKAPPVADDAGPQEQLEGGKKAAKQPKLAPEASGFKNKEKVLILSSRGITHRRVCSTSSCISDMDKRQPCSRSGVHLLQISTSYAGPGTAAAPQ